MVPPIRPPPRTFPDLGAGEEYEEPGLGLGRVRGDRERANYQLATTAAGMRSDMAWLCSKTVAKGGN